MAFADPQSVTINAVAISMPRIGTGPQTGTFQSADKTAKLTVSHRSLKGGRTNSMIRLDHSKIAADPLTADNTRYQSSFWLVADRPDVGYTLTELRQIVDGFLAALSASSGAKLTQLLGEEN